MELSPEALQGTNLWAIGVPHCHVEVQSDTRRRNRGDNEDTVVVMAQGDTVVVGVFDGATTASASSYFRGLGASPGKVAAWICAQELLQLPLRLTPEQMLVQLNTALTATQADVEITASGVIVKLKGTKVQFAGLGGCLLVDAEGRRFCMDNLCAPYEQAE